MDHREFQAIDAALHEMLVDKEGLRPIDRLLAALKSASSSDEEMKMVRKVIRCIQQPERKVRLKGTIDENNLPFARSVAALAKRRALSKPEQDSPDCPIREVGTGLDFLATTCFPPHMTLIQAINLALLRRIRPSKSAAVVATVRDEGLYLLESVAFSRAIGLTDIFIYTNDNIDGSDELLDLLANHRIIRLIRNIVGPGTNPQTKAYQHALHLLHDLRQFKWVLFLDVDEFLVLNSRYDYEVGKFIRLVESSCRGNLPGAVVFPWDWRLSDRAYNRTAGLLFERYPHSIPHFCVKSLTRLEVALSMCRIHLPMLSDGARYLDSDLAPVAEDVVWGPSPKSNLGGSIAHFWGKSFEEFAIKKRKGDRLSLEGELFFRNFDHFFQWTAKPTPDNLHPAPAVLLARMRRHLAELHALPGVGDAVGQIESNSKRLSRALEREIHLKAIYRKMSAAIPPAMDPA